MVSPAHVSHQRQTFPSVLFCLLLIGCPGEISEPSNTDEIRAAIPPFQAASGVLRRVDAIQYTRTVHDILGEHIVVPTSLEPDTRKEGLISVGSSKTTVSSRGVEQYEAAAYSIADQAMEPGPERDALMPCSPSGTVDTTCAEQFVTEFGLRAWRRPLSDEELDEVVAIADRAALELDDFHDGLEFAVATLLQSPYFVYRPELGEEVDGAPRAYTAFELATRLSFFLWNRTPDDELLAAATSGELLTDPGLSAQAERLLADDRARTGVRAFFSDMLRLDLLDTLSKDPTVFVHMSPDVGPSAREETLSLVEHLFVDQDADYRELFTTRTTFLNRKLASIYNVRAPAREGFGITQYAEDSPRRGLLGHASILALNSHPASSSATLRGKFIRVTLMCGSIPPPPTAVNAGLPAASGLARTLRERVAEHLTNPTCAACHRLMDPIGLGLENFDAIGGHRTTDERSLRSLVLAEGEELPEAEVIDASGALNGVPFVDAADLSAIIAESEDTTRCLVRTMYRYAVGHLEEPGETESLRALYDDFEASGFRVRDLMLAIALDPAFREASAPSDLEVE